MNTGNLKRHKKYTETTEKDAQADQISETCWLLYRCTDPALIMLLSSPSHSSESFILENLENLCQRRQHTLGEKYLLHNSSTTSS